MKFDYTFSASGRTTTKKSNKLKRVTLTVLLVLVLISLTIMTAVPPLIMKDFINMHVDYKETYKPEEYGLTAEKIRLETEDGLNVVAYDVYVDKPKAVVIFLSGIHNPSVTAYFGHAKMLQDNGYASALLEVRAHGESDGNVIALGYKEYLDVKALVEHIKKSDKYKDVPIVVFGVSMGGAVAINSIGEIPEIDGLISLSAYSAWEDVFGDNMVNMGAPSFFATLQKPFVKLYSAVKFGFGSYNISPKNEIKKLGDRPALIMHSKDDSQVPYANFERIAEKMPQHVETWSREGDLHFIIHKDHFMAPEGDIEYSQKILGFLDKHFGNR